MSDYSYSIHKYLFVERLVLIVLRLQNCTYLYLMPS
uniref:Uncharacterized protein n=1 Tax=virus sp. ct8MV80 TaxID=2826793 RepID=A0A8S5R8G5_9VIRU|nr:MAG TPA: hypothetical protein [virus sp. ct8MV80]